MKEIANRFKIKIRYQWGGYQMDNENQIIQAIKDLSEQISQTEQRLTEKIEAVDKKVDNVDAKVTVLSNNLLQTQAEVQVLKDAK